MNRYVFSVTAAMLAMPALSVMATDPYPLDPVSEITSRWADAARGVKTLHADVIRFEYDDVYRTISKSEGTLDFERPNHCRLELRPAHSWSHEPARVQELEYQPIDKPAQTIVWSDEALIFISPDEGSYDLIDIAPNKRAVTEEVKNASVVPADCEIDESVGVNSFEEVLWKLLFAVLFPASETVTNPLPETLTTQNHKSYGWSFSLSHWEVLPILPSDPASVREQGYELVQRGDFKKGLTAIPNRRTSIGITHIDILFDPQTGLPYATRQVSDSRTIVHILKNVQLNPTFERKELFHPNLERLTTYSHAQVSKDGQE